MLYYFIKRMIVVGLVVHEANVFGHKFGPSKIGFQMLKPRVLVVEDVCRFCLFAREHNVPVL